MGKILIAFCIVLSLSVLGCGEGLYGTSADKNTKEALQDRLDFAFISGNCQVVIDAYEPRAEANTLSETELYKYNSSLLTCSGFDLVSSISGIFGSGTLSGDPYSIIQSVMGTTTLTAEESAKLKSNYDKILKSCTPSSGLSSEMQSICGMTAAADTVRTLGDLALSISGGSSVELNTDGMKQSIAGKDAADITNAVNAEGQSMIDELNRNLGLINNAADTIGNQAGVGDFSSQLDKFTQDLTGGSSSSITSDSLSDYIYKQFGSNG